ncbi:response regulator transcription factor [Tardiphaga alba]|uniref:Response regulator transcription factor n=1 Tax=Tardiphaga alba TaxID=340268 RepID=A0ABX8A703_9BRAD|nr:response regulator [Tardiphaga alba]QUS38055.1 response regulator transcription factor [Tardiphaga alba]
MQSADAASEPSIVIIDDDADIREALHGLLRSVGLRSELYASVREFVESDRLDGPGCIVLDIRLPGQSGLDFQDHLLETGQDFPIVFISGHADVAMSVRAMKAGAVEFLTKPFRQQDFLEAIHRALKKDALRRAESQLVGSIGEKYATLSRRESEVMSLVVAGKLNKQIAVQIGVTEATVKLHRGQVMRKMGASTVIELVRMADRITTAYPRGGVDALRK